MEVISVVASIAGLLSLSGQVVGGLVKLNHFIQEYRGLENRTESLIKEAELLAKSLLARLDFLDRLGRDVSTH